MLNFRNGSPDGRAFSVEEAAGFMEYDRQAIEYWLRMGHLAGRWDRRSQSWRIRPQDIITFLQQSDEPMPTGTSWRHQEDDEALVPASGLITGAADELTR